MSARSLLKGAMRVLTLDTINPQLIKAQYAVRGELAIRAEELRMVGMMRIAGCLLIDAQ